MENKKGLVMANAASRKTSAVIATYNHESFAYRSIESIAAQVDEVVVIDDNSTDGTKKELERARKDFGNLKIILNSANAGVSVSLNTAIQQATSDFIFLSAGDDLSLPHRVPYQFAQLKIV
jgi:glycosyltransferase involved in cell wall biosynthesis